MTSVRARLRLDLKVVYVYCRSNGRVMRRQLQTPARITAEAPPSCEDSEREMAGGRVTVEYKIVKTIFFALNSL